MYGPWEKGLTLGHDSCLELLRVQAETCFVLSKSGRILFENEPIPAAGPRLYVAACGEGFLAFVRDDVPGDVVDELLSFLRRQPPSSAVEAAVAGTLAGYLSTQTHVTSIETSIVYALPKDGLSLSGPAFICSGTEEGSMLLDRLDRDGFPPHLRESGFATMEDFWPPWCVAFEGKEIATTAFAARLAPHGAEVGIVTFPAYRGRGLGAAVTAKWASLPQLADRTLFYSTSISNTASRRVAEKLGLERIGTGLRIT
ncbi:MAG TPA: GNAT family N-acetyltransferase [Allosphingosinicella sp.]|jgi:GNAT superfamily N-acetyltransferase|nr:GNAT family N-acetyltransferase [Allosphingosinicella sp.]